METRTIEVYHFNELSDEAKEKALERFMDINVDFEWWDFVEDYAKTIAALMGIDISNIYFSGFSSQGDGACFEGRYSYKKGSRRAVKEYAPQDTELHRIATELYDIQRKAFYRLSATVKHSGHYSHKYCTEINVYNDFSGDYATKEQEDAIKEVLRDFMDWIYRTLEKEYDYLTSREVIEETILANEYEFTEDGELFHF